VHETSDPKSPKSSKLLSLLTFLSLLSIVLFSVHWAEDIVRGTEPGDLSNYGGILILFVWTYAAVCLPARRSGQILLTLGSLLASAIPVLHMRGAGLARVAAQAAPGDNGLLFTWTVLVLGATGLFSLVLSLRALWAGRPTTPRPTH
jgi:hypothetical protein